MFGIGVKCPDFDVKRKRAKSLRNKLEVFKYKSNHSPMREIYYDAEMDLLMLNKLLRSNNYSDEAYSDLCKSIEKSISALFRC